MSDDEADVIRCWLCGVEPDEVFELRHFNGMVRLLPRWPTGDHVHAEKPPTPDELFDRALLRELFRPAARTSTARPAPTLRRRSGSETWA